jgi:hypothetical protein
MSTLQHDELLTQSEILEKETWPPVKKADQYAEAEKQSLTNRTMVRIYNKTVVR